MAGEVFSAASLDVFAPAWQEAFGLVFIEAAQCGVPSVSGASGALMRQDTGLLAPAHDIAGLTEALTRLRRDEHLRLTLGEAARQRAGKRFSHVRMTADFMQVMTPRRLPN